MNFTQINFKILLVNSLSLQNILIVIQEYASRINVPIPQINFFIDGIPVTIIKTNYFLKKVIKTMH